MRFKNVLGFGNRKIKNQAEIYGHRVGTTFDLLAGHTCPMANLCNTRVVEKPEGNRLEWGEQAAFTCYAAKIEVIHPNSYKLHKANFEFTQSDEFVETIKNQLWYSGTDFHRWHWSGDFYDFSYFKKVYQVMKEMPEIYFQAYTKRATFLSFYLKEKLPNCDIIYSHGGLEDELALSRTLPTCFVVTDKKYKGMNVTDEGLPIACTPEKKYNDYEYVKAQVNFGIYVH